jgi:molecular chaperone GrpE
MSKKKKDPVVVDESIENETEVESEMSTDENGSEEENDLAELDPVKILEKDLLDAKNELTEQKDKFVRLQAETDNFRKRLSREKEEFSQYANERLFKELLPIFDNFERALEDPSNDIKSLKEGLEMILKQFSSFLEKEKVEPIEAIGKTFDPMIHEVLTSEESSEHEENTIISQFVKGYTINNRVIRPSQVVISKKPSLESEEVLTEESEESEEVLTEESEECPDKEESPTD